MSPMIGKPFIQLDTVDSSNNHAKDQFRMGLAEYGTAFFAIEQTQGRGQRDRNWQSQKGANIVLTVIVDCRALDPHDAFVFNAQIARCCYDFFHSYAGDETSIKWPNDIYWRDRKAGGILIENAVRNGIWEAAFVGIGININQTAFDATAVRPVSLKQITGKSYVPQMLAQELCNLMHQHLTQQDHIREQEILSAYSSVLFKKDQPVLLQTPRWKKEAYILGVNRTGQLLVRHEEEEALQHGEVSWLL